MRVTAWTAALPRSWPWRRLLPALGASVLVHVLVVEGWRPSGGASQSGAMPVQLQARLETTEFPAMPDPDPPDIPLGPDRNRPVAGMQMRAPRITPSAVPQAPDTPLPAGAGATVPDLRFYQARELDRYPAPLAPLNLRAAAGRAGSVRLWLSIDRAGNVVDVAVVDADPSGELESMARESLLATRFMPAVKNERPVKSRILLELRYDH